MEINDLFAGKRVLRFVMCGLFHFLERNASQSCPLSKAIGLTLRAVTGPLSWLLF